MDTTAVLSQPRCSDCTAKVAAFLPTFRLMTASAAQKVQFFPAYATITPSPKPVESHLTNPQHRSQGMTIQARVVEVSDIIL